MQNGTMFMAYLLVWGVYLVASFVYCRWKRLSQGAAFFSHLVPSTIAVFMIGIFLIGGGATIAQFASGSKAGMDLWSLWFRLFPMLLLGSVASSAVHLIGTIVVCFQPVRRKWIPVLAGGLGMSVFGFFTVACNYPDA